MVLLDFPGGSMVKNPPAMQETTVQFLGWEDLLVKGEATHFRKGRGTRDQTASIRWIIKKAREFQKNIYFCFIY